MQCEGFEKANFDIVIEGLGWVSVQGKGFANFLLHIPRNVNFHIRESPLQPFEANTKGLKTFTGNPVNSRTKRNR